MQRSAGSARLKRKKGTDRRATVGVRRKGRRMPYIIFTPFFGRVRHLASRRRPSCASGVDVRTTDRRTDVRKQCGRKQRAESSSGSKSSSSSSNNSKSSSSEVCASGVALSQQRYVSVRVYESTKRRISREWEKRARWYEPPWSLHGIRLPSSGDGVIIGRTVDTTRQCETCMKMCAAAVAAKEASVS